MQWASGKTHDRPAEDKLGMELHPLLDDATHIPAWGGGSVQQPAQARSYPFRTACNCLRPCWRGRSCLWRIAVVFAAVVPVLIALAVVLRFTAVPALVRSAVAATNLRIDSIAMTAPRWPGSGNDLSIGNSWGFTMIASSVLSGLSPVGGTLQGEPELSLCSA